MKYRALRLESGNFSWGTEVFSAKSRILDVKYNASNNELVRTKTLVKGCVIQIDATPFKTWYRAKYGVQVGKKKGKDRTASDASDVEVAKKSSHVLRKLARREKTRELETAIEDQFSSGRLLAVVSSRPGQSGRCDGYILEGEELAFYIKKIAAGYSGKWKRN
jgi:small subunit ribosomal protein S8e